MRLINADEFREIILTYGKAGYRALLIEKISELIDSQSTAYDVDKVVEQLEVMREEMLTDTAYDNDTVNHYLDYVDLMNEIVKSGGIG